MILLESTHKTKDKIGLLLAKSTLTKYGNINRINTIFKLVEKNKKQYRLPEEKQSFYRSWLPLVKSIVVGYPVPLAP